jgi:hypothetical protein
MSSPAESRNGDMERLGHVRPAAFRGELVVPVVHGAAAEQHGETELATRFARGHAARCPVDRPDLVALNVTTEPSTHGRFGNSVEPFCVALQRRATESAATPWTDGAGPCPQIAHNSVTDTSSDHR